MARIELKRSGIIFNEDEHTYYNPETGQYLNGITDLLHRQLFPNEFDGINEETLMKAASYGTAIHHSCEDFDYNWVNDGSVEVADYIQLCKEHNLVHEMSEYNVSDKISWASNIDKVFRVSDSDSHFNLADIKSYGIMTTEKQEKARWQLSIYAYLFELQNKKAMVDHLYIIHLRNKPKANGELDHISELIEVPRIPSDIVKELLDADVKGEQFQNPFSIPEDVRTLEEHIRQLIETKKAVEDELTTIKSDLLSEMSEKDIRTWATETMKITRKLSSVRVSLDTTKLKKEHPEIDYDAYRKESKVSESILITV